MQIKEIGNQGLKREYNVIVPAADIAAKTAAQLKEISKSVKISGFRPGHIPANILKQRYGKSIAGEVLEKAVHDASHQVIDGNKLRPAVQPEIKVVSFEEGKDLELSIKLEVFPEVPELALDKVEISKPTFEIAEKEIDDALGRLTERNKTRKPKPDSAKAQKGDTVRIDFKGLKDGVAFEGGTSENFQLELGSGQFIPGFEDQLIGTKKGDDVKVNVTFPEHYHSKDLAGAPVVFEVKVHEVLESQVPEVNEEFAKELGFESLDALKTSLREHIAKDYNQYVRNRMKKDLFDKLENLCEFEVPESMVDAEFKGIWARLKQAQEEGDPSVSGRDEKELEEEYKAIALRRVRLGIYLAELGRTSNVQVSHQELMGAVVEQARQYPGNEAKVIEFYRKNPTQIEELRGPLFEDKVVDLIFEKVKKSEQKMSLEELVKLDMEDEVEGQAKEKPVKTKKKTAKKAEAE